MRFIQNVSLGIKAYISAFRFIIEFKLYWYVLFPAILMLGIYQIGALIQLHAPESKAENMNDIVWYLIRLLFEVSIALLLMRFAKYLVVIVLSPLFSILSQKVEFQLTGNTYPFSLTQLFHDMRRGFRIAIRNIMWEYFFFSLVYIVAKLGWQNAGDSPLFVLIFFIGFYYYGFSFLDFINERLKLDIDQSIQFARRNRGLAIAIGAIYSIMIWVPVDLKALFDWSNFPNNPFEFMKLFLLNLLLWICAAFAPIWSIVAATIAMHNLIDLSANKEIGLKFENLSAK